MYSVMAAATGHASCVLSDMGLGPLDRCTVEKYCDEGIFHRTAVTAGSQVSYLSLSLCGFN